MTTRILLVDDHTAVREGLHRLIAAEPDFEVVGEAATGEAAIELLGRVTVDLVLMDCRMPGIGGIEATRRLRQSHPHLRVLVLSAFADLAVEALEAGVNGYLLKTCAGSQLIAGMRSVALGATVVDGDLGQLVPVAHRRSGGGGPDGLTAREVQILRLMASGLTNRAIAREMAIAPRTAEQHVHNIFVKAKVKSRSQAVRYAIEQRLIPFERQ